MNWMFYAVNVISVVFEALILSAFFSTICAGKHFRKLYTFLIYVAYIVAISVIYFFNMDAITKSVTAFIFIVLLSLIYKMKRSKQIFGVLIIFIVATLFETVVGFILSGILMLTVGEIFDNIVFYSVGVLASKLLTYGSVKIFSLKYKKNEIQINNKYLFLFMVFPVVTFLVGIVLIGSIGPNMDANLAIIGAIAMITLVSANVLVFYLFEKYSSQLNLQYITNAEKQKLMHEKTYLQELVEKQTQSNKVMHDLKNQLFAIKEVIACDSDKGISKINEICETVIARQSVEYTKNISIDALINSKKQHMDNCNIVFSCQSYISGLGNIDEIDICILLGNLLDNAIEACLKITTDRSIRMRFIQQSNYINIEVENTAKENIVIENNQVQTSKEEKFLHGFGLKSVKSISEKYFGSMDICAKDQKFSVLVMLIMD